MTNVKDPNAPLSVMYVEDDPVTRELVAQTLPKKFPEYVVDTAENGQSGLDLYMRRYHDLVITDVNMPVMNGILMASEIKRLNPDVVIIAVTAYSETNYLLNAIEIGISHYVLKPIDYRKLFEAIEKSSAGIRLKKQFSEQNKLIAELNAALEKRALELAEANTEMEKCTYSLYKRLQAPINTIRRSGEFLLGVAGGRLTDQEIASLSLIVEETQEMDELVKRGILEFSRVGNCAIRRDQDNLSRLAGDIAGRIRRKDGAGENATEGSSVRQEQMGTGGYAEARLGEVQGEREAAGITEKG